MELLILAVALLFAVSKGSSSLNSNPLEAANASTLVTLPAMAASGQEVQAQAANDLVNTKAAQAANDLINVAKAAQTVGAGIKAVTVVKDIASNLVKATPAAAVEAIATPAAAASQAGAASTEIAAASLPASSPALSIAAQVIPVVGAMAAIYEGAQLLGDAFVGKDNQKTVEQNIQEDLTLRKTIGEAAYQKLQPSTAPPDSNNPNISINKTAGKPVAA